MKMKYVNDVLLFIIIFNHVYTNFFSYNRIKQMIAQNYDPSVNDEPLLSWLLSDSQLQNLQYDLVLLFTPIHRAPLVPNPPSNEDNDYNLSSDTFDVAKISKFLCKFRERNENDDNSHNLRRFYEVEIDLFLWRTDFLRTITGHSQFLLRLNNK
jgi:hypothetical protein